MTTKAGLMERLERAYMSLLDKHIKDSIATELPTSGTVAGEETTEFADQTRLLDSAVRFLAIKHRINPEDETDGISGMVKALNGRASSRRTRRDKASDPGISTTDGTA